MTGLTDASIATAASTLWEHWRANTRLEAIPADCRPSNRAEGYAIAAALAAQSGQPVIGWKIAATSEAGQRHINVEGPLAGRLLRDRVKAAGAALPLGDNIMNVAEAEFAFGFGRTLPSRGAAYSQAEVLDAVDSLHLSIEIPDSRYSDFTKVGAAQIIADTACASWLVTQKSTFTDWRDLDLAVYPVILHLNGSEAVRGTGKAALGDPRAALTWLVNEVSIHAAGIKTGDIVTTGTCVIPAKIKRGDRLTVDYGRLGTLSASIT